MRPLPSTRIVPRSACSAAWIVIVPVIGAGVLSDGEELVVGKTVAGLPSTTDGDGVEAVPSAPQAEANKMKAVVESTSQRWVRLEKLAGIVCILRLEVWPESHWPGFALRQTDVL